jgi:hypothetical protein
VDSQISFRRVNEIGALIVAAVVINADTAFIGAGVRCFECRPAVLEFLQKLVDRRWPGSVVAHAADGSLEP